MKYAITSQRGRITQILDEEPKNLQSIEISDEEATVAEAMIEKRETPILFEGKVTSRKAEHEAGNLFRWDDDLDTFVRTSKLPVVPDVVDMWKLKAILDIVGKTAMIETVIAGIPDDDTRVATQAGWKHASTIERGHSLVQAMIAIPSLDINEEDMDEYFLATKQYDK
jgi:hypothetical protein